MSVSVAAANAPRVPHVPATSLGQEAVKRVEESLQSIYNNVAPSLKALIIESKGLIAGGFVLNSLVGGIVDDKTDVDIYVQYTEMPTFLYKLTQMMIEFTGFRKIDATIYCRSFLRKNGIRRVHTFQDSNDNFIDVMSVRRRKTPQEVCSNFDLTFCQVWYDGKEVFATHPEHIKNKKGYLQGEYIKTFAEGNLFLKNRVNKYRSRGFEIMYDPSYISPLPDIDEILKRKKCVPDIGDAERYEVWAKHVVLRWLTYGISTEIDDNDTPYSSYFTLPLHKDSSQDKNQNYILCADKHLKNLDSMNNFHVPLDEGYDSEDMDIPKFKEIVRVEKRNNTANLTFARYISKLLLFAFKSPEYSYSHTFGKLLEKFMMEFEHFKKVLHELERQGVAPIRKVRVEKIMRQKERSFRNLEGCEKALRNYLRVGTDFASDEGQLYDIHYHPLEGATTRDTLEGYLQQYIRISDKSQGVPCYYKPFPLVRGQPEDARNCKMMITQDEIMAICSYDFQKKFFTPQPVKTGLNQIMPYLNAILPNVKTMEPGYGEEFHDTMCPFCLQPINRNMGCSYMTHENPKRLPHIEAPYCDNKFLVKEILNKYKTIASHIPELNGVPLHMEVCVECGAPCVMHQHFDLNADPEAPRLLPSVPREGPRGAQIDYSTCPGGGRVELFARMLAVRDVYMDGITNPQEERLVAALAADNAAQHPEYLSRAQAILDMPPEERKFNVSVPETKKYNNVAYAEGGRRKSRRVSGRKVRVLRGTKKRNGKSK